LKIWVDAQMSPAIATWLASAQGAEAVAVREIGLREASDADIFFSARTAGAVVMSKDQDFVDLLLRHGPPPQIIWITCGNTSNARLQDILTDTWPTILQLLAAGENLIEVGTPGKMA
jgi:predicted nuclease of predicted toxin-antitoxin system